MLRPGPRRQRHFAAASPVDADDAPPRAVPVAVVAGVLPDDPEVAGVETPCGAIAAVLLGVAVEVLSKLRSRSSNGFIVPISGNSTDCPPAAVPRRPWNVSKSRALLSSGLIVRN